MKLFILEKTNEGARIEYGTLRHMAEARSGFRIGAKWQAKADEEKLTKLAEALKELLKIEPLVAPGEYFEAWDDAKTEARAALKEIGEEVWRPEVTEDAVEFVEALLGYKIDSLQLRRSYAQQIAARDAFIRKEAEEKAKRKLWLKWAYHRNDSKSSVRE